MLRHNPAKGNYARGLIELGSGFYHDHTHSLACAFARVRIKIHGQIVGGVGKAKSSRLIVIANRIRRNNVWHVV